MPKKKKSNSIPKANLNFSTDKDLWTKTMAVAIVPDTEEWTPWEEVGGGRWEKNSDDVGWVPNDKRWRNFCRRESNSWAELVEGLLNGWLGVHERWGWKRGVGAEARCWKRGFAAAFGFLSWISNFLLFIHLPYHCFTMLFVWNREARFPPNLQSHSIFTNSNYRSRSKLRCRYTRGAWETRVHIRKGHDSKPSTGVISFYHIIF